MPGSSAPATFLYRVALNTALVWHRGRKRIPPHTELEPELSDDAGKAPAAVLENVDRDESLYRAIRGLPDPDRDLILMHLDGLSYREMAAVTGLTETNVGARLSRARDRLADLLGGGRS